jgi:hypothetical protein
MTLRDPRRAKLTRTERVDRNTPAELDARRRRLAG